MNLEIILSATIIVLLVIIFILVVNKSNIKLDTKIDKRKRRSHKKNFKKASQVEIKALQALVKYALNHYSRI
jgi:low affinity Fe/Cu permease